MNGVGMIHERCGVSPVTFCTMQCTTFAIAPLFEMIQRATTNASVSDARHSNSNDDGISATKSTLTTRIISGSIGSVITSLVVTPLEVVKVRAQAAGGGAASAVLTTTGNTSLPEHGSVKARCPPVNLGSIAPASTLASPSVVQRSTGSGSARGCGVGTFVLYNGHYDCVLAKNSVSFFDKLTGAVKPIKPNTNNTPLGTFATIRRIFQTEGLAGLYSGLRPTLVMAAPNTVMYYTAYEEIVWRMRQASNWSDQYPFLQRHGDWLYPLLAGGSARLVSSTATAPLEFLRTRQAATIGQGNQSGTSVQSSNLWSELRFIVRNEGGIATLYRGLRPTLWRDVPFSAIYWLVLEQLRILESTLMKSLVLSPMEQTAQTFINGALAGMIAAACTTPFDLAKTRQQTILLGTMTQPRGPLTVTPTVPASTGTFHQLSLIAQTDGVTGLWRGNQARVLKVAPACAIMLSSYELGKRLLE
jgi:solute carrier family 25, member 39/40